MPLLTKIKTKRINVMILIKKQMHERKKPKLVFFFFGLFVT
jgi:hypothetical protein